MNEAFPYLKEACPHVKEACAYVKEACPHVKVACPYVRERLVAVVFVLVLVLVVVVVCVFSPEPHSRIYTLPFCLDRERRRPGFVIPMPRLCLSQLSPTYKHCFQYVACIHVRERKREKEREREREREREIY